MSRTSFTLPEHLRTYILNVAVREDPLLVRLRGETSHLPEADMQIAPEQGQLMALLARMVGARNAVEVGVFTGYSSLCVSRALLPGGRLVACDRSEEWTSIARKYWREAGVQDLIDLRLGPAVASLDALISEGGSGTFDFAFIDADKANYENYYERILTLLRPGGIMTIDNTLQSGRIADPKHDDPQTTAVRRFNQRLHDDNRIDLSLIPIADGLTLAMKR